MRMKLTAVARVIWLFCAHLDVPEAGKGVIPVPNYVANEVDLREAGAIGPKEMDESNAGQR